MSIPPSPSSPSLPYVTPTPTAAPAAALGPGGAVLSWPPSSSRLPLQATIIPIHLVGGSCSATAVAAAAAQLKNGDNGEQTNERTSGRQCGKRTPSGHITYQSGIGGTNQKSFRKGRGGIRSSSSYNPQIEVVREEKEQ